MEKELKRIDVLQAGKVLAMLYGTLGLLVLLLLLVGMIIGGRNAGVPVFPMGLMVVLYPILGFLGGIIMAALYNIVARWIGGFRFTVESTGEPTVE